MAATAEGSALAKHQQDRMCRSKKRFAKQGLAIDWVIRCRQRGVFRDGAGRVYKCPVCAGYHVTSHESAAAA